jgi:Transposase IS66 family
MTQIHKGLQEVFGLQLSYPQLHRLKARAAGFYAETYASIQKDIVGSPVLHIDETTVNLRGKQGHVWVLASLTNVFYSYRESREARFLADLLMDFSGVLVSDFFTGYDALKCAQQKCLVHLLRDINEDLLRRPFDEELKSFGARFGLLLRDIFQTVDKYGLNKRHLQKHKKAATRFVEALCRQDVTSTALHRHQKKVPQRRR